MTKKEKAESIIQQGGECRGISCCHGKENECPCYSVCTGGIDKDPRKITACQLLLDGIGANSSQPVKTLLDEYAIAAMGMFRPPMGTDVELIASDAFNVAAAMLREKMRRDEVGNVKEKEVEK